MLLEMGVNKDAANRVGCLGADHALYVCAVVVCMACASLRGVYLLQKGSTALMVAPKEGYGAVVQMLLDAGANKEAADKVGCPGPSHALELFTIAFVTPTSERWGRRLTGGSFSCRLAGRL